MLLDSLKHSYSKLEIYFIEPEVFYLDYFPSQSFLVTGNTLHILVRPLLLELQSEDINASSTLFFYICC